MDVLVVDVGGSHVKLFASTSGEMARIDSHEELSAKMLVRLVVEATRHWRYDVISLGYPGAVGADGPRLEPGNLGDGWVGFDFAAAFRKPVRVVNDAVMQALGGYAGGRMLFIGLGTGVGSALVSEHVVVPMELGNLLYRTGETLFARLGRAGLAAHGQAAWGQSVVEVIDMLRGVFLADYIVLGGGNAELVAPLPPHTRRGGNEDAFAGGVRLWEELVEPHDRQPSSAWRVVR